MRKNVDTNKNKPRVREKLESEAILVGLWIANQTLITTMERAEGAARGPELVVGSDNAGEPSEDAIQ
jgi:hypothetical protein